MDLALRLGALFCLSIMLTSPSLHAAGRIWRSINDGFYGGSIRALAIDPSVPQMVYAGTGGGVFKSTDGGGHWSRASIGLISPYINALVIDVSSPQTVYAGSGGRGMFKSTDGGGHWSAVDRKSVV